MGAEGAIIITILALIDLFGGAIFILAILQGSQLLQVFMATILIVFNMILVMIYKSDLVPKDAGGMKSLSILRGMDFSSAVGNRKRKKFRYGI